MERRCVCVQGQHIFSARPYSRHFWLLRPPGLCCNCLAHPQATSGSCASKSLFTKPGEGDRFVPFLLPCVLLLPLASSPGAVWPKALCDGPSSQPLFPGPVAPLCSLPTYCASTSWGAPCFASCPHVCRFLCCPVPPQVAHSCLPFRSRLRGHPL